MSHPIEQALSGHPAVAACRVADGTARVVPEEKTAPVLHRSVTIDARGLPDGVSWHEPAPDLRVAQINRTETDFLHREVIEENAYFRHGVHLAPGAVVVDVGANIGMFSLLAARTSPGARLVLVEPIAETAGCARLNMEVQGVDATVLNCALGATSGAVELTYYPRNSVMSGAHADTAEDEDVLKAYLLTADDPATAESDHLDRLVRDRMVGERRRSEVRTLTDVAAEQGLDRIDLLKIDVEKAEEDVLDGVDDALWPRIGQLVIEVHDLDGRLARTLARLGALGYRTAADQDPRLTGTPCHTVYAVRDHRIAAAPAPEAPAPPPGPAPATLRALEAELRELAGTGADAPVRYVLVPALDAPGEAEAALPGGGRPEPRAPGSVGDPAAGRTEASAGETAAAEQALVTAWSEIFGPDAVREDADFFDLGGDSLTAVRLLARLESLLGELVIEPDVIFTHTRFGDLAAELSAAARP